MSAEGEGEGEGYFVQGPDFVDAVEDAEEEVEEVDERELQRLTRESGFGLGGWVDRVIGWSMLRGEEDDGEEGGDGDGDEGTELKQRRDDEGIVRAEEGLVGDGVDVLPPLEDEGGWRDAAWLLSVASKIIL